MFGPNTHLITQSVIDYSHRDKAFFDLYNSLTSKFKSLFNLEDYDILFIPGSGTIGIESVFFSILKNINLIGHEGVFTDKWRSLSKLYGNSGYETTDMFCHLETSVSRVFDKKSCIVDAVSSFPYYSIPDETKIFVTCSNKQLGSIPGLSIVGVRKDYWKNIVLSDVFSYLNLKRYKDFALISQTPSTPPITIFQHLYQVLLDFDPNILKDKINNNSKIIVNSIGRENIIGDLVCPVITFSKSRIPQEIADKFQLYGHNTSSKNYQIFTYSCDDRMYKLFSDELYKYKSG